jgi:hypothetical protein
MTNQSTHQRPNVASMAALAFGLLALVASSAGIGYAAGQIGTNQIKNNAVTSAKVKNKTLTAKDMVKEEKQKPVTFTNGGQGDCIWQPASLLAAGLGAPKVRIDRFGVAHLSGIAISSDGAGGDGDCDDAAEAEDGIAFILPTKYIPAKTMIVPIGGTDSMIIVGVTGLVSGPTSLPAGAVYTSSGAVILDNIDYLPKGSKVVANKVKASGSSRGLDRILP